MNPKNKFPRRWSWADFRPGWHGIIPFQWLSRMRPIACLALGTLVATCGACAPREGDDEVVLSVGAARLLSGRPLAAGGLEYRFGKNWRGVHPYLAAHGVEDGAYYLGGGLLYRWELPRRWRLTLSSGPGYYDRQHSPRDLGSTLEFYSNVELARHLTGGCQIGLSFGHISNGGFGNENPGSETLRLVFVQSIDRWRRR
ncbi:acyloxyacyl hydrolase [Oleiharenicola sp. Vm1]|jgi:hypothetical protein|uniref:acyloxyacyl hydrolase n=1 Tax=Oleiharenicola sp. Vm1 TaxID=3398393 RepID=UPI0039F54518